MVIRLAAAVIVNEINETAAAAAVAAAERTHTPNDTGVDDNKNNAILF